jgi:molybdopterin-containing oxidoreductase family iron-sulfur binding subunit
MAAYVGAIAGAMGLAGFEGKGVDETFVKKLVEAVTKAGTKAVFTAGPRQPAAIHAVVAALNSKIASEAVAYKNEVGAPPTVGAWTPGAQQLATLADKLAKGEYDTLLILGGNPVWNAPADVKFEAALANAKLKSIHLSTHADETSEKCTWHLPRAHYLEAWGDVQSLDGNVSIAQPLIAPMFNGKSVIELLAALGGIKKTGLEIVRETHKSDDWTWANYLKTGVVPGSDIKPAVPNAAVAAVKEAFDKLPKTQKGIDISLYAGNFFDGRFSNNAWLAEMPEPMTRLTWDNACLMNPKTAKALGLLSDDVVEVTAPGGAKVKLPVLIQPGIAEDTFALALGYGRGKVAGSISSAEQDAAELVGVNRNGYLFATLAEGLNATGLTAVKADERYILCTVQDHNVIDSVGKNRMHHLVPELVVEGTLAEYQKAASLGVSKVVSLSMFNEFQYNGHKWGMAIDLTTCTGCSACVMACQAENNVPIVGKEQVGNGREMQWIRIDRYFKSGPWEHHGAGSDEERINNPQAVHQPILCMHCEMAPCESVCPVAATTHSDEGLNMMTYNRCIGTRYCSNNCPYKVRRFNFFDYNAGTTKNLYKPNLLRDDLNEVVKMQKNPQVTVRTRGVMEKCTYCVQRIETTRITAKNEGNRAIADGEIQTACQQVCPTSAIVFGDLNNKDSKVSKLHAVARTYGLLDPELNTKPRTRYIAKLRNPVAGLDEKLYEHELELDAHHGGGKEHDEHAGESHPATTGAKQEKKDH